MKKDDVISIYVDDAHVGQIVGGTRPCLYLKDASGIHLLAVFVDAAAVERFNSTVSDISKLLGGNSFVSPY